MCGRYPFYVEGKNETTEKVIRDGIIRLGAFSNRYNIAPTQEAPVIYYEPDGKIQAGLMRWGLVPSWAKDPSIGNKMINVRAESVAEKPSFKQALQHRRCLVLASGFYEWKKGPKLKTPVLVSIKDTPLISFAGLWENWRGSLKSFTIITTEANEFMKPIHNRMPVVLSIEAENIWMDSSITDPAKLIGLLKPLSDDEYWAYPVSTVVNSPKNDSPECIKPDPHSV